MRCCVPFCENISNSEVSKCDGISFHVFPDDPHLRAAWLMSLGLQHTPLPDSAVICSQHFLCDDICVTDSGLQQLNTKTVPSSVQVCMICLNTDSKMFLMNKYKLDEAYEILTGYPLCDGGNLKQTLCVQCAQRLRNFSRFRDLSLRAHSLIMNLVARYELITKQHIKMINSASDQLKNNLVLTTLGPDHCDLHIVEHGDEDTQPTIEETGDEVKQECSDDSMSVDQEETIYEGYNTQESHVSVEDSLKYESALYICTVCDEKFQHEHVYSAHVSMSHHSDDRFAQSYSTVASSSATNIKNDGDTTQLSERALVDSGALDDRAHDSMHGTRTSLKNCVVKLYDFMKYRKNVAPKQEELLTQKGQAVKSCDILNAYTAREDGQCRAASEGEVPATRIEPASLTLCDMRPCSSAVIPRVVTFTCDVCKRVFTKKQLLVNHMKTHTGEKPFACKLCEYKCAQSSGLTRHIRSHTGEKPFSCKLCEYKCAQKSRLTRHIQAHSGEKPFSCELCEYKSAQRSTLTLHMRTHSGEKPFSCELCKYKCARSNTLTVHMLTHSGEKPFSCKLCEYKCAQKSLLTRHIRSHSGEKPYSCELCEYKCAQRSSLTLHMWTHSRQKPIYCELCEYKCARSNNLTVHMRTHSGEKPFSCKLCEYRCAQRSALNLHMWTHSSEKPFSCELCEYKCARIDSLTVHMRTHSGEKPFSCKLCEYKCARIDCLTVHMQTHSREKPFSCKLCEYKCALKTRLTRHMWTHSREKPFACKFCEFKCAERYNLTRHMRTHFGEKRFS